MVMQLSCMQVTMSTRKVDWEERQRQAMSDVEQLVLGDESMQSLMHCGKLTCDCACESNAVRATRLKRDFDGSILNMLLRTVVCEV